MGVFVVEPNVADLMRQEPALAAAQEQIEPAPLADLVHLAARECEVHQIIFEQRRNAWPMRKRFLANADCIHPTE